MGLIKTTRHGSLVVAGPADLHYREGYATLQMAGFVAVRHTGRPGEMQALCRDWTLRGEITVVVADCPPGTLVTVTARANADNVYALGGNPAEKIIARYMRTLIARLGQQGA